LDLTQEFYQASPDADTDLPRAVTTQDAIHDLPPIHGHLTGELKRGIRRLDELVLYDAEATLSEFAGLMRNWPSFENSCGVRDHVIRSLPRDYAIFKIMKPGDQYPEAWHLANTVLLPKAIQAEERKLGRKLTDSEKNEISDCIVPPYDPYKFPNKWRKLEAFLPSRTLMAHIGKDTYSHIHYDSGQARTISVREAARLQSFPDGFVFSGTMNPAFRQIGNAVPPLLALSIAEVMYRTLTKLYSPSIQWRVRHKLQTANLK
jgi:DNA (cytosine-5)-methyltransferase 1